MQTFYKHLKRPNTQPDDMEILSRQSNSIDEAMGLVLATTKPNITMEAKLAVPLKDNPQLFPIISAKVERDIQLWHHLYTGS